MPDHIIFPSVTYTGTATVQNPSTLPSMVEGILSYKGKNRVGEAPSNVKGFYHDESGVDTT